MQPIFKRWLEKIFYHKSVGKSNVPNWNVLWTSGSFVKICRKKVIFSCKLCIYFLINLFFKNFFLFVSCLTPSDHLITFRSVTFSGNQETISENRETISGNRQTISGERETIITPILGNWETISGNWETILRNWELYLGNQEIYIRETGKCIQEMGKQFWGPFFQNWSLLGWNSTFWQQGESYNMP